MAFDKACPFPATADLIGEHDPVERHGAEETVLLDDGCHSVRFAQRLITAALSSQRPSEQGIDPKSPRVTPTQEPLKRDSGIADNARLHTPDRSICRHLHRSDTVLVRAARVIPEIEARRCHDFSSLSTKATRLAPQGPSPLTARRAGTPSAPGTRRPGGWYNRRWPSGRCRRRTLFRGSAAPIASPGGSTPVSPCAMAATEPPSKPVTNSTIPARPNAYEHGTPPSAPGGGVRDREPHSGEQRTEQIAPLNACPACRHRDDRLQTRQATLDEAFRAHPNRFKGNPPGAHRPPNTVWINKPASESDAPPEQGLLVGVDVTADRTGAATSRAASGCAPIRFLAMRSPESSGAYALPRP